LEAGQLRETVLNNSGEIERLRGQLSTVNTILAENVRLRQELEDAKLLYSESCNQSTEPSIAHVQQDNVLRQDLEQQLVCLRDSLSQSQQEVDQSAGRISALQSLVITQQVELDELRSANIEYARDLRELRTQLRELTSRRH
jgi:hypothetical protein